MIDDAGFLKGLPKVELHVHIEGTLEPEMMFLFAERNEVPLPWIAVEEVKAAYKGFTNLQSFLDIYYQGAAVLRTTEDFHDLMAAYLARAHADGVRHAEIFFDPQTHTERGVPFATFMPGFDAARREAKALLGIGSSLIMCFLRHLPSSAAEKTLDEGLAFRRSLVGVGLDSSEVDHPPEEFSAVFARARAAGLRTVSHAGEEGPPSYITGALDSLKAERIDHGVQADQDRGVVLRLENEQVPLTMCPLSNVRLKVFGALEDHNLKRLMDQGVVVTINSDDPAYFGGYIADNYIETQRALGLSRNDMIEIARNSITASFLEDEQKAELEVELDRYVATHR